MSDETTAVAEAPKKSRKGRSTKDSFMEVKGIKSLTSAPSIPDEFDPERYNALKETDFDDVCVYKTHREEYFLYRARQEREERERLEQFSPEARAIATTVEKANKQLQAALRRASEMGVDFSSLLATTEE